MCAVRARHPQMAIVTLRLFSVYGPWEEPTRLIPTVIRRARAGLPLEMVSPDVARDFVFIGDVLRALLDFERLRRASRRGHQPGHRCGGHSPRGGRDSPGLVWQSVPGRLGWIEGSPVGHHAVGRRQVPCGPDPELGAVGWVPRGADPNGGVDCV